MATVDLAAMVESGLHAFYGGIADVGAATWMQLTSAVSSPGKTYKEARSWGITTLTAQGSSAVTPFDIDSESSTTTPLSYEGAFTHTYKALRDNPGLLESDMRNLAGAGMLTISNALFAIVAACESTAHPFSGTSIIGQKDGAAASAVKVADEFRYFPKNSVSEFNQSNLYGVSFSADAVTTMLAARAEYLDRDGNPYNTGMRDELPFVIVPASKRQEAEDIRAQRGLIYDGAGLQSGSFQERTSGVVVPPGVASNENWGLWYRERVIDRNGVAQYLGPIYPVINKAPTIKVDEVVGYAGITVSVEIEFAIHVSTSCDLNFQWSSP